MGMCVAVTGVFGHLGTSLLGLLERHSSVDRIIGVDAIDISLRTPKLEFHTLDVRDPELGNALTGADILVHLAFCVETMRDPQLMHDVNVGGFSNVLLAVEKASVGRLVYASSGYVYGAHADNRVPLYEDAPLRPSESFAYAEHKAETEALLCEWQVGHSNVEVTVLRPGVVLGRHASGFIARRLASRWFVSARSSRPPLQALHEQDLAQALLHFSLTAPPGVYNLCSEDVVERDELLTLTHSTEVRVPDDVLFAAVDLAWKIGLSPAQPGEWDILVDPLILSNSAAAAVGWTPLYSTRACVAETVERMKQCRRGARTR